MHDSGHVMIPIPAFLRSLIPVPIGFWLFSKEWIWIWRLSWIWIWIWRLSWIWIWIWTSMDLPIIDYSPLPSNQLLGSTTHLIRTWEAPSIRNGQALQISSEPERHHRSHQNRWGTTHLIRTGEAPHIRTGQALQIKNLQCNYDWLKFWNWSSCNHLNSQNPLIPNIQRSLSLYNSYTLLRGVIFIFMQKC